MPAIPCWSSSTTSTSSSQPTGSSISGPRAATVVAPSSPRGPPSTSRSPPARTRAAISRPSSGSEHSGSSRRPSCGTRRRAAIRSLAAMTDAGDPWERHAAWWQEQFTDGADPEYTEQILPLAAEHLAGAERVLDIGAGEGQLARVAAEQGASLVVGIDPSVAQLATAARRGGGPRYV